MVGSAQRLVKRSQPSQLFCGYAGSANAGFGIYGIYSAGDGSAGSADRAPGAGEGCSIPDFSQYFDGTVLLAGGYQ